MRAARATGALAVAGLVLSACGAGTRGAATAGGPTPAAGATSPTSSPAPASQNPPGLTPATCDARAPAGAVCSTLWVSLDYANPSRGTIPTAVMVVPATDPAHKIGSLLVNPGGPGESGVQFVEELFSEGPANPLATLNQVFDIVGFDPRGTTGADAVSCEGTQGLDHVVGVDPDAAGSPAREADLVATSLAFADACGLHSGWLLPYLTTANTARDMDALRAALGDTRLTYLGFSYGTYLGAIYASLFPTHIRALVLDGDLDPALSFVQLSIQQGASFEASYQEFLRRCTAQASCPLGAQPGSTITGLLDRLAAHPVSASDGRSVGRGLALTALIAAMYDPTQWGVFYSAFALAARGEVDALESLADALTGRSSSGYDHSLEANAAINCADHAVPESLATYDGLAQGEESSEPLFGESEVYSLLSCAYWPVRGAAPAALHVTTAPPILLVGATHDPATPYAWSQALQQQLAGSVLLTRDGYGHTSYEFSRCVDAAVDAYLEQLVLPAAGTVCATD
jgi:pimeloyl-ACP methyl ester carboxylesterase